MKKSRHMLTLAFLLLCSGAALAQTPDGQTPSEEAVCDSETGAAFGLCNAYCEAMDCESSSPQASETACTKVRDKFQNITGRDLPCRNFCRCQLVASFNDVLAGTTLGCFSSGDRVQISTSTGVVSAISSPTQGSNCAQLEPLPSFSRSIPLSASLTCVNVLRQKAEADGVECVSFP